MNPLPGNQLTPLPTSRHWLPNHRPPNPPEDPLPPTAPPDIRCDHHPPITGASADIGSPIQLGARTPRLTDGYWRLALPGVASADRVICLRASEVSGADIQISQMLQTLHLM